MNMRSPGMGMRLSDTSYRMCSCEQPKQQRQRQAQLPSVGSHPCLRPLDAPAASACETVETNRPDPLAHLVGR